MLKKLSLIFLIVTLTSTISQAQLNSAVDTVVYSGSRTCINSSITLSVAKTWSTYQWQLNGTAISGATSATYPVTQTGNYKVVVKDPASGNDYYYSDVQITFKPTARFTSSPNSQCGSTPVNFTSTSTGNGLSFVWNFGDVNSGGNNTTSNDNPSHTFIGTSGNSNQIFSVALTVRDNNGCTDIKTNDVTIKQLPDASITDYISNVPFTNCGSSTFDLVATNISTSKQSNTQYQISWGDAKTPFSDTNFTTAAHTYNSLGYFTIVLTVTGQNGCVANKNYSVYNGTNPAVPYSNPGSSTNQCIPFVFSIPSTSVNNTPGTVYTFKKNDGTNVDTYTTPPSVYSHSFDNTSCGATGGLTPNTFYVIVRAENPCGFSDITIQPITTSKRPTANFSIAPNTSVCTNSIVTFNNTSIEGISVNNSGVCNKTTKSNWVISPSSGWTTTGSLGDSNPSNNPSTWGSTNLPVVFTSTGTYSVKMIVRNSSNPIICSNDTITKTICVTSPSIPAFTLDKTTGCLPLTVTTVNTTNALNSCMPLIYNWSVTYANAFCGTTGNSNFTSGTNASSTNPSFIFNNSGKYTITLSVTNPCGTYTTTQTVDIKKPPTVDFTIPSSICAGTLLTPTHTITNCGTTALTYAWNFSGGTPSTSTAESPSGISLAQGTQNISLGVTNECGTTNVNKQIVVNPIPTLTIPPSKSVCAGTASGGFTFTSNAGTLSWTIDKTGIGMGNTASGNGSINSFTAVNSGTAPIVAKVIVTASNGTCNKKDSFNITINPAPALPTVTSPVTYCQNATANALTATVLNGQTLQWYTVSSGGTGTNSITPSTTTAGSTTYYVSQVNSTTLCEGARASVLVTINAIPVITSSSSTNTSDCGLSTGTIILNGLSGSTVYSLSYVLNGNTITANYTSSGSGVITISNLASGTYNTVTVTSNSCTSLSVGPFTISDPTPPATPTATSNAPLCSGGTLTLNASSATTGITYKWSGPNSYSSTIQNPSINNVTTLATGIYSVTATLSGCTSAASTINVIINQTPAIPNVVSNSPICSGNDLNINSSSSTSGVSYNWTGPNNFTSSTQNPTIAAAATTASGIYSVTASNGTCTSLAGTLSVTVKPTPVISGTTSSNPTNCATSTGSITITGLTKDSSYTVNYTKGSSPISASLTANASGSIVITGLSSGSYTNISVTLRGCESNIIAGPISLTDPTPPATPTATSNAPICSGGTLTLNASSATTGITYKWSGPNSYSSTEQNPSINNVTTLAAGTYSVTATLSGCTSTTRTVVVLINPTPVAPTVSSNSPICSGNDLNINSSSSTSGVSYNWTGPNNFTSSTQNPTIVAAATTASGIYSVTASNGTCTSLAGTLSLTVKPTPVISGTTSSNPTNCATSTGSITITGLTKDSSYTVNYTKGSSPISASLTANASGSIVITGLSSGSYTNISVTLRGCESNIIAGPISLVDPTPPATPKATSNAPICTGKDLKLFATTTTIGSGITYSWSRIPNTFSSTDQNPVIANATTLAAGTYSVTATLNSCESEAGTVVVVVDSTPAKPIVSSNAPLCFGSTLNLSSSTNFAGAPNSLKYEWTGPNSFTSIVQNPIIPAASELASGRYILKITANASNCVSDTASTQVLVRPLLTQAVISGLDSVFVCGFAPPANATQTLTANLNSGRPYETGKWRIINQPISSNASFGNSTAASTTFTYDKSGFYKLEWAINNDINCPITKDTVVLSIIDKPAITQNLTASAINVCAGNPVTISVPSSAIIGNIRYWQFKRPYNASSWTDTLITSPTITFNNVQDTFKVRLAVIATDQIHCNGDTAFKEILINVAPPSLPGVSSGVDTVCKGSNTGTIALIGNIGTPFWQSSIDGLNFSNTAGTGQTYTYTNLLETTWFRAAVKSGACDTVFSNATKITVYPPVTQAIAGVDAELCGDTTYALSGNALGIYESGLWSFAVGSPTATINNPTNPNTVISKLVSNSTYQLVWTLSNGICPSTQDLVIVKNYLPLTNNIDTASLTVCNSVILTVTGFGPVGGNTPYLYQWQVLKGGNWINIVGANSISYTFTADTTVKIRRLVTALPCTNASLEKTIYVQPPLGNNIVNGNVQTCINTSPGLLTGSLPSGADGNYIYQWQMSSSATGAWINIAGATNKDYPTPVLIVTTYYRRLVTSAFCSGNQGLFSAAFEVIVRPDAAAQWAITKDTACAPFNINNAIVNPIIKPLKNSNYSWYANNVLYGNSSTVNPGYILENPGDSIVIKMVANSLFGCKNDSLSHQFFTIPKLLTAFVVSDTAGCGPLLVKFTNTTPHIGFFTYSWNFGNNITSKLPNPGSVSFASNPNFTDTTYRVVLTAKGECETVTAYKDITVKSKPKSIFTPNKTAGCSPLTVGFTNISKGLGVSYLWDFGDGSVLAASTPQPVSHVFSTGVQDTFKVKLIAINQCGNDTSFYSIVVSPNKIKLDFAVNGNQKQVCKPGTISFINSTSGATNFQWNFGDGNVLSTTKNLDTVLHTYLQYGNFNVTLTATNGCSDTTSTELIQVFNSPSANFAATPLTACLGDTIRFTNQSDTITSLLWNFKDGYTSTVVNPVHAYKTPGVYNVVLKAIRQYNSGLACTDTIVKPITIVSKLTGAYKVSDSISSCVPFTVTFTNLSLPSALTTWQLDNGNKDTGNVITHTFTKVGDFIVTMLATNPGGCQYEAIKTIKVNGPEGTFKYDKGFVCGATPVRFEAFTTGTDSVKWNFGDGIIQTTSGKIVYHIYQSAGTFLPTATLLTNSFKSCSVLLKGLDTIKVDYVNAGFAFTETKVCGLTTVQFKDTSRHFYPLTTWQWSFGDGTISNLANTSKSYTTTNTWLIDLTVKSQSGCVSSVSKNLFIKVNDFPVAQITTVPLACTNRLINYVANVTSNDSVNLYSWQFSNGVNLNGKSVAVNYNTAGTYSAKLLVRTIFGCADSTNITYTVNATPTVVASVDQLICRGKSVPLTVTGAVTYSWVPLNSNLSCYTCTNPIAAPLTTTNYVVTGYSAAGCANDDTVLITVAQPIKLSLSPNDTICIGQSSQLFVSGATTYVWSPSIGLDKTTIATPIATPTLTTKYQVIGFDNHNCFQDTASVIVAVGKYPTIQLGADKVLATGTLLPLNYTSTNGPLTTFLWSPSTNLSCNNCPLPIATVKKDVCYTVVAANQYKCAATDTLCIKVFCENTQVFIPNVFTPDNDGVNDVLMVRGTGIKTVKSFRIFNRWGQIVFERGNITPNNASQGWDGKINGTAASPDVYVYTCEVVCENDVTFTYKGNVAIIK